VDAGNPHVQFDERGWETDRSRGTAPILDSTRAELQGAHREDGNAEGLIWETLSCDEQRFFLATDAAARGQTPVLSGIFGQGDCQC
jgi:hypothetical protein